jgi:hypothetical protein
MTKGENPKPYDLEARTFAFAQRVRVFVRVLKRTICNIEDGRQPFSKEANDFPRHQAAHFAH